ncbi:MAG: hypothetical protein IKV18_05900 [Alistipes sp.]|nr:hypothetical protein [Alistipes sp.]
MKRICILLSLLLLFCGVASAQYKGILISDSLTCSKIYPDTKHRYWVYVPQEYDGEQPACLYVGLDGVGYNAPSVMDELIASAEMPVTIGVFVQAGKVYNEAGDVVRYNRSNEFDRTDDKFARFLTEELLPHAVAHTTPDGRKIHISPDANDHAIAGSSSGGIAAFSAAWFRPDLFRRVFTTIGTFVSMRGGNELPALVRKTEPLPLRIYIHDGSNDVWNPIFGHWYEYNQLMGSALEFAGYDFKSYWDDCKHSNQTAKAIFPEVMRFLWNDYPAPIKAGESKNNMLSTILIEGEGWQPYDGDFPRKAPKSALSPDGKIFTKSERRSDWLVSYVVDERGHKSGGQQFYWLHNPLHQYNDIIGMIYATDGCLYVATQSGIQVCDHNGRVRAILRSPSTAIEEFAFVGNTIYIKVAGKSYSRRVQTTAHPNSAERIEYRSQGEG